MNATTLTLFDLEVSPTLQCEKGLLEGWELFQESENHSSNILNFIDLGKSFSL